MNESILITEANNGLGKEADRQLALKKETKRLILFCSESLKQLLVRSRYLLYKSQDNWTIEQSHSASILFEIYPTLSNAYNLTQQLRWIFNTTKDKMYAFARLAKWNEKVEQSGIKAFNTLSRTIINHHKIYLTILITEALTHRRNLSMLKSKPSEHNIEG